MSNYWSTEISRRNFLALLGSMSAIGGKTSPWPFLDSLPGERSGVPLSPAVVRGNVRFQILSPTVVRMEYAPSGQFIDAPSVSVLHRHWAACPYEAHNVNGLVEIATGKMQVRYKSDSGPFSPENLAVSWKDADGDHAWKPGDVDERNLGGVTGDISGRWKLGNDPGPLSRNGYFRLDDSTTAVWNAAAEWPEPRPTQNGQDWYFFAYGRDYKLLLRELTQLLGPIPMVPRYIFGTWFGSSASYCTDEWQRIAYCFRDREFPIDVMLVDSLSWAAMVYRGFGYDPEQMPDPAAFLAWMKAHGFKVTLPGRYAPITPDSDPHFEQVRQALGLPAGTKEIAHDLADKKFAQILMDVLLKPMLDLGMAFWFQDGCAPANMSGLDPMLWMRQIEYEGQERITGKRTFIFARLRGDHYTTAPPWGVHRYPGYFTGDEWAYWSTLDLFVPYYVQSGNMLEPYTIGIASGDDNVSLDHELYQRWNQLAAFAPIFWWDGGWGQRLPWEYGDDCFASAKLFLTLRYQLLPYIYTYSRLVHETSVPLVRGTYLEYPQQEPSYTFTHQYLFGQELLVAPISQPGGGRPVRKEIYLPEGEHWFDYFTGRIYPGGQVLAYECPLNRLPLFVKAGSVIPMAPEMDYTDQRPVDPLILDIYAGKASTFRLYEDDGVSLDYRKHAYAWTPLSYEPAPAGGAHLVRIGPAEGRYEGQPKERRYRLQVHGLVRPARVLVQGRPLPEKPRGDHTEGWIWHRTEQVTEVNLTTPTSIGNAVNVTLEQAGEFSDAVAVQAVRAYRERVIGIKSIEKLRWAMLLYGSFITKEPHVLQETERVEQALNDLVDHPVGLAGRPADFKAMTASILNAFLDQPFNSTRKIPSREPACRAAQEQIANGAFEADELHRMTAALLDCRLSTSVESKISEYKTSPAEGMVIPLWVNSPIVRAWFSYDTACIGPPQLDYELSFPDDGPPGWAELRRFMAPDGSMTIITQGPYPPQEGKHTLKLKVIATWGSNRTVLEREVVWVVGPLLPDHITGALPGEKEE